MKVFHCHNDLEKMRPPSQVFGVVKQELDKLLKISGGDRIDPDMVKRVAKKGSNVGNQFWGCSSFPKCRAVENI